MIFRNINIFSSGLELDGADALFVNCTFENGTKSAIDALQSKVIFQGNNIFRNNSALAGAGISLTMDSYMYLEPHTHILFEGNHADYVGGAIYTDRNPGETCFYHVVDPSRSNNTVQIIFFNNTAQFGGSSIYGDVSPCCGDDLCKNFYNTFNISNTEIALCVSFPFTCLHPKNFTCMHFAPSKLKALHILIRYLAPGTAPSGLTRQNFLLAVIDTGGLEREEIPPPPPPPPPADIPPPPPPPFFCGHNILCLVQ